MPLVSGTKDWSKVVFLAVNAFLRLSFTQLIATASFITTASSVTGIFFVIEPLVDCFKIGVEVLSDGSAIDPLGVEFPVAFTPVNDAPELDATTKFLQCFYSSQLSKFCNCDVSALSPLNMVKCISLLIYSDKTSIYILKNVKPLIYSRM